MSGRKGAASSYSYRPSRAASAAASAASSGDGTVPASTSTHASPMSTPIATTTAASETAESTSTGEVDTSTHVVVEHHHSGTVKTHVFRSTDGHLTPEVITAVIATTLDCKLQALDALVQDSIDITRKESLDKIDALRIALEGSEGRIAAQISHGTTSAIEAQIKTEVLPKFDKIEQILYGSDKGKGRARDGPRSSAAEDSDEKRSNSSLDPMDVAAAAAEQDATLRDTVVLEKLTTIESQVGALCKVVIEGQVPLVDERVVDGDEFNAAASTTSASAGHGAEESEALARMIAMRDELLTFPDTLKGTHSKIEELIQALDKNRDAVFPRAIDISTSTEDDNQVQKHQAEQQRWQDSVLDMMRSNGDGLTCMDSQLRTLDSSFKNMDAEFHEWRRSHKLSLQVYLKYMYLIYKRTENVDTRIYQALEDIKNQTKIEPEQRAQFSNDLAVLRAEIMEILTSLPETILSRLKSSDETSETTKDYPDSSTASQVGGNAALTEIEPQPDEPAEGSRSWNAPTTRALGVPGPKLLPDPVTDEAVAEVQNKPEAEAEVDVNGDTWTSVETNTDAAAEHHTLNPAIDKLTQRIENLQADIASMIEKYGELFTKICPPGRPLCEADTVSAPGEPATVSEDMNDAPEPPPRENRANHVTSAQATATCTPNGASPSSPAESSPISPFGYHPQAPGDASETTTSGPTTPTRSRGVTTASVPSVSQELEVMNRNLSQLLRIVNESTSSISRDQTTVRDELHTEFQRLLDALPPRDTVRDWSNGVAGEGQTVENEMAKQAAVEATARAAEERQTALDRIGMIPNLMQSLENVNYHQSNRVNEVLESIQDIRNAAIGMDRRVADCQIDVKNLLEGSMQDSRLLCALKDTLTGLGEGDQFLKAQVAEAIKTLNCVLGAVEGVKDISERTFTHQMALETKLEELHKKHDDGWQAWDEKHITEIAKIDTWHDKHDQDMRDLDEWRHKHREELLEWHEKHHRQLSVHDERHCSRCFPGPTTEEISETTADDSTSDNVSSVKSSSHKRNLGDSAPAGASRATSVFSNPNCCGSSSQSSTAMDVGPARQRARELFEEFLRDAIFGYDGCCLACGRLSLADGSATGSISDVNASGLSAGTESSSAIAEVLTPGHATIDAASTRTASRAGSVISDQASSVETDSISHTPSSNDPASGTNVGESASYHGAVEESATNRSAISETPAKRGTLPQDLHDLLRPYFVAEPANAAEPEDVAALRKELSELQEQHMALATSSKETEESSAKLLDDFMEKNKEIDALKADAAKKEEGHAEQIHALEQERDKIRDKLAVKKRKLKEAKTTIETLYREGLGLGTAKDPASDMPSKTNGDGGDSDSTEVVTPPRYRQCVEASEQLSQVLEEFKVHKPVLHIEIRELDEKKSHLIEETARLEIRKAYLDEENARLEKQYRLNLTRNAELDATYASTEDSDAEASCSRRATKDSKERIRARSAYRPQKRQPQQARAASKGPSVANKSKRIIPVVGKIPQLEADIKISKDGIIAETLLCDKTLLSEDQFERIRSKQTTQDDDPEMWSLFCDFKVRMVNIP